VSVVGFVVAGGASRRMGRDKALLPWGDTTLLDHAIARLREVTSDVRILCGPEPRYAERGLPVLTDTTADAGALAGVHAGLVAQGDGLGLFLAVDLPNVPVGLLRALVEAAQGWDAVVPATVRGPEPLCAVYGAGCRQPVERRLAARDVKMTAFWPDVRVRDVGPVDLRPFGDPERLFLNLNTADDYVRQTAA